MWLGKLGTRTSAAATPLWRTPKLFTPNPLLCNPSFAPSIDTTGLGVVLSNTAIFRSSCVVVRKTLLEPLPSAICTNGFGLKIGGTQDYGVIGIVGCRNASGLVKGECVTSITYYVSLIN